MVSVEFFIYFIFPASLGAGVDTASNRHGNKEYFLVGGGGVKETDAYVW